jgi:hypothetical protein
MDDDVALAQERLGGGESRYTLERSLGRGGMGQVYLAWDRELGEYVALKMLLRVDAEGIARLKHEFRALLHISHPSLVKLYELEQVHGSWYFTMEYVDGVDLLSYVKRGERPPVAVRETERRPTPLAHARLVQAFYQLASAVRALHRAGKLHRDLKPANVLVSAHRVVVLDFGLVADRGFKVSKDPSGQVWGTPEYMAPEFADAPSEASDWYAFGTMLYEALTHELPYRDTGLTLLLNKQRMDPPPPSALAPAVPRELDELCVGLLGRDPTARPSGASVVATFEALAQLEDPSATLLADEASWVERASNPVQFVGRTGELAALSLAYRASLTGNTQIVHVRGLSGAGKSALVERFLAALEQPTETGKEPVPLVLRGRCYEREALPFKALDGVVDALSLHLARFDDPTVADMLPPDVEALAQLFPALGRLNRVQALLLSRPPRTDPHTRQLAAVAAAALLRRLSREQPVVVWIDDLQWGDVDSAQLLRSLLRIRGAALSFVLSYRSDEASTSTCLEQLLEPLLDDEAVPVDIHDIEVRALGDTDITALIRERLGSDASLSAEQLRALAHEAHGSPFIALQLSALLQERITRGAALPAPVSVDNVVAELNGLLPLSAQKLLAFLAVAGRPLPPALALRAASVRDHGRAHLHTLHALNLVRMREVSGERLLEVYHDRVREGVLGLLPPARMRRIHKELLRVLEENARAEPDFLHIHARGANNGPKAYRYAREAAERAMEALAFDRAVYLYRECLSLVGESSHQAKARRCAHQCRTRRGSSPCLPARGKLRGQRRGRHPQAPRGLAPGTQRTLRRGRGAGARGARRHALQRARERRGPFRPHPARALAPAVARHGDAPAVRAGNLAGRAPAHRHVSRAARGDHADLSAALGAVSGPAAALGARSGRAHACGVCPVWCGPGCGRAGDAP